MQRSSIPAILVGSSLVLALGLTACSAAGEGSSGENVSITFMPIQSPNLNQELWEGVIEDFEIENPNITVEFVPSTGEYISLVKTLNAAGNLPDVIFAISNDFALQGITQPLPEDVVAPFANYERTAIDGEYYFVPVAAQPQSLLWYNKDLFAEAGIAEPPTTLEELSDAVDALKAVTDVPISITGEWTTGWQTGALWAPLGLPETPDWYAARSAGEVTFAGSAWETVAEELSAWAETGALGPSPLSTTYDQGGQLFIAGGSAIYPMGVWFGATLADADPAFEVGVVPAPSIDGSPQLAVETSLQYALAADSDKEEAALEFIRFATQNVDVVSRQLSADGLFSNAKEPVTYELSGPVAGVGEILANASTVPSYSGQGASIPLPGFTDFVNTQAQSLVLGDITAAAFVASLDQWWEDNK